MGNVSRTNMYMKHSPFIKCLLIDCMLTGCWFIKDHKFVIKPSFRTYLSAGRGGGGGRGGGLVEEKKLYLKYIMQQK